MAVRRCVLLVKLFPEVHHLSHSSRLDVCPADGVRHGRECKECQSHNQHWGTVLCLSMAYNHICTTLGFVDYHLCLFQSNGSVNVHIDMDQPVQSEPRLRLVLAENLLRDINDVIQRMEVRVQPSAYSSNKSPEKCLPYW